jgi:hypothetical protein
VDPTTKFGISPAYDTQSQALFATLSTAGGSVTQDSHQVQNTDDPDISPGNSEATPGDALGVTITVPTSSVTHPNPVDDASNTSSLTGTTLMALTPTDPTKGIVQSQVQARIAVLLLGAQNRPGCGSKDRRNPVIRNLF